MEELYVVTAVYSNEDDGTGCEPKIFSDYQMARNYFNHQLKLAFDDFVSYDYVSQGWADFFYSHVQGLEISELDWNMWAVEKWRSLQYEVDEFGIEFWNDIELNDYDFWYSINLHKLGLNQWK